MEDIFLNKEQLNNIIAVIPARGGSKGIPRKNIKDLAGKPLIQYSLDVIAEILPKSNFFVSTEDMEIKQVAEDLGYKVPFTRPEDLARDTSSTEEVLLHAVNYVKEKTSLNPEILILLQPTSPFRTTEHVKQALKMYMEKDNIDMVVSVMETKSNPYYVLFEEDEQGHLKKSKKGNFTRRQDCPKVWEYNGSVYIINVKSLVKKGFAGFEYIVPFEMDEESSLDLDTEMDWKLAVSILS